jgi:hypothetical protein
MRWYEKTGRGEWITEGLGEISTHCVCILCIFLCRRGVKSDVSGGAAKMRKLGDRRLQQIKTT